MISKKKNVMYVSNDLGYGVIKAHFDDEPVKQDSVYTQIYSSPTWENIDLTNGDEIDNVIKNLLDKLDVSINDKRYLIGKAALDSLNGTVSLQMDSPNGKANGNSAIILPLAYIAGRAIQKSYYDDSDEFVIGDPIQVNVNLVTALPISESRDENGEDTRPKYVARFTDKIHTVVVHSLGEDIVVRVKFDQVVVLKEGQIAASSAIKHGNNQLAKKLIEQVKQNYPDKAEIAESLILEGTDYISIDIGQGTTDMALFYDGSVNDFSYSINSGFGNILEDTYNQFHNPLITKKEDFVKVWKGQTNLDSLSTEIDEKIQENSNTLQTQIISGLTNLLRKNPATQVIYIFGGGSVPMIERYHLEERIKDRVSSLQSPAVVVWVGKEYAQDLNEIALKNISDYLKAQAK